MNRVPACPRQHGDEHRRILCGGQEKELTICWQQEIKMCFTFQMAIIANGSCLRTWQFGDRVHFDHSPLKISRDIFFDRPFFKQA